jgi:hypothetical protein
MTWLSLLACTSSDPAQTDPSSPSDPPIEDTDTGEPAPVSAEDCSGVTSDPPTWTLLDPIEEYVELDLLYGDTGSPQVNGFSGVAFGHGRFVAIAANLHEPTWKWATSGDGYVWETHEQALPDGSNTLGHSRIWFQRGLFIKFLWSSAGQSWVMTSEDGVAWTATEMGSALDGVGALASSDELTVLVGGNNELRYSADLVTWTEHDPIGGSFSYTDLDYGNGLFISTTNGFDAGAWSSPDGVTWTRVADLTGGFQIDYGDGVWLARATSGGGIWTSPDGASFTPITPTGFLGVGPLDHTGGRFLGAVPTGAALTAYVTEDGATWSPFGDLPSYTSPDGGTVTNYVMSQACGECTCVMAGQYQDFTMGTEWLIDYFPLLAVGQVLPSP